MSIPSFSHLHIENKNTFTLDQHLLLGELILFAVATARTVVPIVLLYRLRRLAQAR